MKRSIMILLGMRVLALVTVACGITNDPLRAMGVIVGSGDVEQENREVLDFHTIVLEGSGRLHIVQTGEMGLIIEADDNVLRYLTSDVKDGVLTLGVERGKSLSIQNDVHYYINVDELRGVTIRGAGYVDMDGLNADSLELVVEGSGDIEIENLSVNLLEVRVPGSADIELSGEAGQQSVAINGNAEYKAEELQSDNTHVTINGSGDVRVAVSDELEVLINGSGDVRYHGDPSVTEEINGSGSILSLD